VTMIDHRGVVELPAGTKAEVAHRILDHVVAHQAVHLTPGLREGSSAASAMPATPKPRSPKSSKPRRR
jgi:hypothetical protein